MTFDSRKIGEVKLRRLLAGLTQQQVARLAGCDQKTVSRVESGTTRSGPSAAAIFSALERIERERAGQR